ncbi:LLM class flavin-dependent oxidoreductase [Thalassiella azotivora]
MTDYGQELRFGTFLTPTAERPGQVVALAQLTEQVGLDLVTVQDHPYQPRFLDAWTLLAVVAARTERVAVAPNVANLPLRPPAVLAKSVASLDLLTGGRVELGLGSGAFWEGVASLGGGRLAPGEAVTALEEALDVVRGLWDTERRSATSDGRHHRVHGARTGPAPAHPVEIWLGAYKPRMLRLTARRADGWLPSSGYADPDALAVMTRTVDEAAAAAGRDPAEVRRLYNVSGTFGRTSREFLAGHAGEWAEQLTELALGLGTSTFVLGSDDPDTIRRFAAEVAPAVREAVEGGRRGGTAGTEGTAGTGGAGTTGAPDPTSTGASAPGTPTAPSVPAGLGVVPTPDDGTRLTEVRVWDEGSRPTAPAPDPDATYTAQQQASGQHLVDVHDMLRGELAQVRDLMEQVLAGTLDAGAARSHVNVMTMRQNKWTLGTYCESYCRVVTTHHTIEDVGMFPHLRGAEPALEPVIDRLEQEHHAIHDVLEGVDRALVAFVASTDGGAQLRAAVDLLTDTLLSHLAYEERELVEPLARHGFR